MTLSLLSFVAITFVIAALFISADAAEQNKLNTKDERPYIVTTTAHLADLASNIAGDKARIHALIGPGIDPHLYRPLRSDIVKLSRADIIFYNGRHLEGQMAELLQTFGNAKPSIAVGDQMDDLILSEDGAFDPHLWMDVNNWIQATDIVAGVLKDKLPTYANEFADAAENYKSQLRTLDSLIRSEIENIPKSKRVLITAHDAFAYYGEAYDMEVIGIQGISTASEAGLHQIEAMVNLVSERQIPALFAETSVSDQNIKAIIEGARRKGHNVSLGGTLYSDSLGKADSKAGTYIGMMKANTETIVKALNNAGQEKSNDNFVATSN